MDRRISNSISASTSNGAATRKCAHFSEELSMQRGILSRRGFLQRTLAGLAATGLPAWYARDLMAAVEQQVAAASKAVAANDKLTMGIIGVGSPQSRSLQIYNKVKSLRHLQFTSVCDVDAGHLRRAAGLLKDDGCEV